MPHCCKITSNTCICKTCTSKTSPGILGRVRDNNPRALERGHFPYRRTHHTITFLLHQYAFALLSELSILLFSFIAHRRNVPQTQWRFRLDKFIYRWESWGLIPCLWSGQLGFRVDSNILKFKPLLIHAICHKLNQNRMKNKSVTDACIIEN